MIEQGGKVVAMRGARDGLQPAPEAPEHAPGGPAVAQRGGLVALDRLAHGQSCIPRTQNGKFIGIGETGRVSGGGGGGPGEVNCHKRQWRAWIASFRWACLALM
ncbi:hypothetical protein QFZ91_005941 [Paraburkholderia sp. JPY419]